MVRTALKDQVPICNEQSSQYFQTLWKCIIDDYVHVVLSKVCSTVVNGSEKRESLIFICTASHIFSCIAREHHNMVIRRPKGNIAIMAKKLTEL